jgi:hypothetical protein
MQSSSQRIPLERQRIGKLITASAIIAAVILPALCASALLGLFLTHAVHESGHALACVAQGGYDPHWSALLRPNGMTNCKPTIDVITTIGGPVVQLSVWIVGTVALMLWASHWTTLNAVQTGSVLFWVGWSLSNVSQPISWMRHLTPTNGTEWDPARLIRLTHISPATVITGSWVAFAVLLGIAAVCSIRLARPTWAAIKLALSELVNKKE